MCLLYAYVCTAEYIEQISYLMSKEICLRVKLHIYAFNVNIKLYLVAKYFLSCEEE